MAKRSVQKAPIAAILPVTVALLSGAPVAAQVLSDSAPQPEAEIREAVEIFKAPSPLKLGRPKCDFSASMDPRLAPKQTSTGCLSQQAQIYGNEGWVVLNFMVDAKGKPFEVTVTQSTGNKYFEQGAISAIQESTFVPGSLNGMPIESGYELKFKFADSWQQSSPGATRKFIDAYKALADSIAKGDRDAADLALQNLRITNLYEDAYFGVAKYSYARK